jgi:hypothetical protein
MEKCGDRIELVEFPSAQHGAGYNAADRVYPGHSSESFVIVDAMFLPVAFDN